jgi:hypothetical protein
MGTAIIRSAKAGSGGLPLKVWPILREYIGWEKGVTFQECRDNIKSSVPI